jgi:outer membrane protein TolC
MAAAVRAAAAVAAQASALDDPIASAMVAPLSLGGGERFGYELRASQRIPYPGKRQLRGQVAASEATTATEELQAARLDLAAQAASLFADYYLNAREREINAEHISLLDALKQVATARYAAGLVPQQAPVQAEVEAARMLHHDVELRTAERRLVARINAMLHRPAEAPLPPPPAEVELPAALTTAHHVSEPGGAIADRPELRARRAELAAREAELELSRRSRYPDFEVMTSFSSMWDMPEHRWAIGLGVNVPIRRGRIRAAVAAAQARVDQGVAELQGLEDTLHAEAVGAIADREEMTHLIELYRDRVLPAARDQVAAARVSFESGNESMLGLIEAERSLRDAQQQYHEAVAGSVRAQAALARTRGELPGNASTATEKE